MCKIMVTELDFWSIKIIFRLESFANFFFILYLKENCAYCNFNFFWTTLSIIPLVLITFESILALFLKFTENQEILDALLLPC